MRRFLRLGPVFAGLVAGALVLPAAAQMRIDVSGVGATQLPIAIAGFATDSRLPLDVAAVVRGDLARSGAFRVIDPAQTVSDTAPVDFAGLRSRGAETFVAGSVAKLADGRYDVRYRLYDAVKQTPIAGESVVAPEADLRLAGHRIADAIFEKLTGEKGVFSTRIAFVSKQGTRFRLNVADWDGENVQSPLVSPEPIISPSWSPDGGRLAYVSFEQKKPVVYVHTLATGQRVAVANFKGSNSAPAWSPDGRTLAVALTLNGLSQIYLINAADGANARRLTTSNAIDTEPVFSPDGRTLFFTSDRGGSPQIYRMPVNGGDATRVTFGSSYNVSPRVSPDGRSLAFLTRRDGRFFVGMKDLAGGNESVLTDGGQEESPSFSPNGRWIMYATQQGGRDSLMAISVDGRVRQRLSSSLGDIREPSWGPFLR
ncbi:MAG: Tol-Pal system beta propeller repeat protein TolB [Burkholderiaceae bacterium]|jgi:TolB protein|nr:Tol-Pal system protein TolB [Burkholderiales bacterium]MCZ8101145.1 Tol-Pal system beta propeller repeat protein TolB [Burkholderiales bacterium]MCZ8338542.1 Tol-Pal system beta propeller repeat protein TolB [Burkholderiaceae bacterium]